MVLIKGSFHELRMMSYHIVLPKLLALAEIHLVPPRKSHKPSHSNGMRVPSDVPLQRIAQEYVLNPAELGLDGY